MENNNEKEFDFKALNSSLRFFDFSELTPGEILLKFEETLFHRETQIKELSGVIGELNEKIINVSFFLI